MSFRLRAGQPPFIVAIFVGLTSAGVAAQEPDAGIPVAKADQAEAVAEDSLPAAPQRSRQIDEIVVTATKRAKSVREIPVSIDVFSGDELSQRGADTLEQILQYSPGVSYNESAPDQANVTIRGINSSLATAGPSTFGVFYDEVPLTNPSLIGNTPDLDPYDLASVEILKGPQGTLFGGSALAGVIRYVPKQPDHEESYGGLTFGVRAVRLSGELGSEYGAYFNQPLHRTLAVRVTSVTREKSGYMDDLRQGVADGNDYRVRTLRAAVLWEPVPALSINLGLLDRRGKLDGLTWADNAQRPTNGTLAIPESSNADYEVPSLKLDWDIGPLAIIGVASRVRKAGAFFLDGGAGVGTNDSGTTVYFDGGFSTSQSTYELRAVSENLTSGHLLLRNWEYAGGLFYMNSAQGYKADIYVDPAGGSDPADPSALNYVDSTLNAQAIEKALYFDATRFIGERWELNLGLRWFDQTTDGEILSAVSTPPSPLPGLPGASQNIVDDSINTRDIGINPKLALTWRPTPGIGIFTSASKGFRFGGLNVALYPGSNPTSFGSDSLWNYELGLRSEWFERSLLVDLTAFRIDWTELQIGQTNDLNGAYVDNVGGARVEGIEASTQWLMPWGVSLSANAAYLDARTTVPFDSDAGPVEPDTRLPLSARLTSSLLLSFASMSKAWSINGTLSYAYSGGMTNSLQNEIPISSFKSVGASLTAVHNIARLQPEIALRIVNLLDERTFISAHGAFGGGADVFSFMQPRTMTLSVSFSF